MSEGPTQILPDGEAFVGYPWSEQVDMTVKDGSGTTVNMTGATYTVTSKETTITLAYDATAKVVGLSLTVEQVAALGSSFRWYLGETTVLDAPLYWRRVNVGKPR